jgi:glycerophosphoryl diester phosphodiesterase
MHFLKIARLFLFIAMLLFFTVMQAQNSILPNAYAHNDYWHKRPLLDALDNGFTYVEADVYLRDNQLVVAHILPRFKKVKTLEALYMVPLLNYVTGYEKSPQHNGSNPCCLTLMIDIKSNAGKTYEALELLLEKYKSILSDFTSGQLTTRNVTVIVTGHKPTELITEQKSRRVFMDEDLKQAGKDSSVNIYPIASCKYSSLIKWKGKGYITNEEVERLKYYVTQAHKNGRKVRLWASPENKKVWSELLKCNVDLINTDKLIALRKFLTSDMLLVANIQ